MSNVGALERKTKTVSCSCFNASSAMINLGNGEERPNNRNIEPEFLRPVLRERGYSAAVIEKALHELEKIAGDQNKSLYDINKAVYGLLRYGIQIKADVGEQSQTVSST